MTVTTYRGVIRRGKVETMETIELPDGAEVYVVAAASIAAPAAKRIANRWLVSEVGNLLMADRGDLIRLGTGWVWQFEIFSTAAGRKPWGPLGVVRIDAASGEILDREQTKINLYERARTDQPSRLLAISLFAEGEISLAKASALADMHRYEFALLLKQIGLPAYEYSESDYAEDASFAATVLE